MGKNDVQLYSEMIDDMRLDEAFEFAEDTLKGIYDNIKEHNSITENQKTAVENILNSKPHSQTYFDWGR